MARPADSLDADDRANPGRVLARGRGFFQDLPVNV
jgi:hypothetical protein